MDEITSHLTTSNIRTQLSPLTWRAAFWHHSQLICQPASACTVSIRMTTIDHRKSHPGSINSTEE